MPNFQVVLQLDDDEKEKLAAAADSRTFTTALKAHGEQMRTSSKQVSFLTKGNVSSDDLEAARDALSEQRSLLEPLADSEAKSIAVDALDVASATVDEIARAVAEHR